MKPVLPERLQRKMYYSTVGMYKYRLRDVAFTCVILQNAVPTVPTHLYGDIWQASLVKVAPVKVKIKLYLKAIRTDEKYMNTSHSHSSMEVLQSTIIDKREGNNELRNFPPPFYLPW